MVYNIYFYDRERDAVVVTDMEVKQLVIECKKAEAQVVFEKAEVRMQESLPDLQEKSLQVM